MTERDVVQGEEALKAEVVRLNKVVAALIKRAEQSMNSQNSSFGMFQNTLLLEQQVRRRTQELEIALRKNEAMNRELQQAKARMEREIEEHKLTQAALEGEKEEQKVLIRQLEDAHCQLLQSEKLASIGQLAAGVAHEINNPICFVNSNLGTLKDYAAKLLDVLAIYESCAKRFQADTETTARLEQARRAADIDFLREDMAPLIDESLEGTERVKVIVQDLRGWRECPGMDQSAWLYRQHAQCGPQRDQVQSRCGARLQRTAIGGVPAVPAQPGVHEPAGQRGPGYRDPRHDYPLHPRRRGQGADFHQRYRLRRPSREPGTYLRPILHHQAGGEGDRAGAIPLLRHCRAPWRTHRGRQCAGSGLHLHRRVAGKQFRHYALIAAAWRRAGLDPLPGTASGLLGAVHRGVSRGNQFARAVTILREEADADAA